ncbi:MAG: fumarate hydratase [Candidatus Nanopelagicales bacterium]
MAEFQYTELLPLGEDKTAYRKISDSGFKIEKLGNKEFLVIEPETIKKLTFEAMHDSQHYLRTSHLKQLRKILDDNEASNNDKFVALDLLKNANISSGGVLPMCQDTGTVIITGKRGSNVITNSHDEEVIAEGVFNAYQQLNLRYSQLAPLSMWEEKNTGTNLPAQIEIYADTKPGNELEYSFMFMAKGGGSANKSLMYQETKALLNPEKLDEFLEEKLRLLGTAACPPYHLAIVIGGTSAEYSLKVAKLATTRSLDSLPTKGSMLGHGFRDLEMEEHVLKMSQTFGIGAQFGGKYFCHDVRVIRLPRHGASLPVSIAVSCAADRQILAKINKDGVFLEQLETDPAQFLPETTDEHLNDDVTKIDLNKPMKDVLAQLSKLNVKSRVSLTGSMIVARDLAHAKINQMLDEGKPMPDYMKNHAVYYAGPAKTPKGMASGSFGPTTAGRMDSYVDRFQKNGGSMIMLAKGNRSQVVTNACKNNGGFYLGSIGGPAALLAQECIKKVEVLDFEELGMEAVWKIDIVDFPAFVVVDDKGNNFFDTTTKSLGKTIPVGPDSG